MSNKVSYIYIAHDKYSRVAEKVARVTNKVRTQVKKAESGFSSFKQKVHAATISVSNFGNKMKSAGAKMTAFATLPIVLIGSSMIKAASDAEETQSKFEQVFKSIGNKSLEMAETISKNYGLASSTTMQLLGDTGDLLIGFGLSEKAALDMSAKVTKMSVDMTSFKNVEGGAKAVSLAVSKALLGERESLKTLGIAINETDVKRKIANLRAQGSIFQNKRQAQAVATLALIQERAAKSQGDFANTSHLYAGQVRIFGERIKSLKEKFGKLLLPIALKVLQVLTKVIDAFEGFSPETKKIILVVAGLVAVIGPLLLGLGAIASMLPLIGAGFVMMTGPVGIVIAGVAAFLALRYDFMGFRKMVVGTIEQILINMGFLKTDFGELEIKIIDSIESVMSWFGKLKQKWDSITTGIVDKIFELQEGLGSIKGFFGFDSNVNLNQKSEQIIRNRGKSRTDVNVNLRAPENTIQSVRSKSNGNSGVNIGLNMVTQ